MVKRFGLVVLNPDLFRKSLKDKQSQTAAGLGCWSSAPGRDRSVVPIDATCIPTGFIESDSWLRLRPTPNSANVMNCHSTTQLKVDPAMRCGLEDCHANIGYSMLFGGLCWLGGW